MTYSPVTLSILKANQEMSIKKKELHLKIQPTFGQDNSSPEQIKRQFKNNRARHITQNIYQLTLSKNHRTWTKHDLDKAIEPLGLSSKNIQYISQNHSDILVNLTIPKEKVKTWIK